MQYKVITKRPIWVKSEPSNKGRNISVLYSDSIVTALEIKDTWIRIEAGWVNTLSADKDYVYLEQLQDFGRPIENTKTFSVGDIVKISSNDATYLDSGQLISNTTKEKTYSVSALSEDGSIALLNFPAGERILTRSSNLEKAESKGKVLTNDDTTKADNTDSKSTYDPTASQPSTTKEGSPKEEKESFIKEFFSGNEDYFKNVDPKEEPYKRILDNGISIESTSGIFGMPYQYMPIADRRIVEHPKDKDKGRALGRKFAEKIFSRMPLLVITPGLPEFMPGQSDEDKKTIVSWATRNLGFNKDDTSLNDLIKRSGKYYTLRPDRPNYFSHVNPMCRIGASFLNIQDKEYNSVPLKNYNWDQEVNKNLYNTFTYKSGVAFYIHSDTQVSDSFSNDDTRSQLADKINNVSDMGREINFLLGTLGSQTGVEWDKFTSQEAVARNQENQEQFMSRLFGASASLNSWFKNITNQMSVVASGGKLIFPNIWSGSSFQRSYDVTIKLVSPDYDIFSWYLNIFVPLMHLFGFVLPRQAGPNGYISPFLVKAYYKGLFNCDLGLITNMSVTRGSEGGWTRNGLPTTVDVTLTIKDLYESISITKYGAANSDSLSPYNNIVSNIILMDYIANLCGININKPDIKRMIDFYFTQGVLNQVKDKVRLDVFGNFDQWFTNQMMGIYRR